MFVVRIALIALVDDIRVRVDLSDGRVGRVLAFIEEVNKD